MTAATELRDGVASLVTSASGDLAAVWREVSTAVEAREALQDILPAIVDTYGAAAASFAAAWYDDLRDKLGVPGSFSAVPAPMGDSGTEALAGWGVTPLFAAVPDWVRAQTMVEGGLQRRIANASRQTIVGSSLADPAAGGWQRTGAGSCAFCAMLIGRGAVYSEASADFASHDHCHCSAVPAFNGLPHPVKPYTPTSRNISDADRARVRAYLASH